MALVLKTSEVKASVGSNPTPSVYKIYVMELVKHTNLIYEYKNIVDLDICSEVIDWLHPLITKDSVIHERSKTKVRHNSAINITMMPPSKINLDTYKNCHNIFGKIHERYINDNSILKYLIGNGNYNWGQLTGDLYYRTYSKNDYYDWHVDTGPPHLSALYSYILYLNDDFEGGCTMFLNEKKKISPKSGNILCFPCDLHHIHKSSKIISGNKHVLWTCLFRKM